MAAPVWVVTGSISFCPNDNNELAPVANPSVTATIKLAAETDPVKLFSVNILLTSACRFLMLDAAGFAPALRGAVTRASRARTARKLADALRDVLRDPDAATALVDDPHGRASAGLEARRFAEEWLSAEAVAESYNDLFFELGH